MTDVGAVKDTAESASISTTASSQPSENMPTLQLGSSGRQETAVEQISFVPVEDGDASDASMSADSDDGIAGPSSKIIIQETGAFPPLSGYPLDPNRKRKFQFGRGDMDLAVSVNDAVDQEKTKRFKSGSSTSSPTLPSPIGEDKSHLPAEIWHHIFTFTSPKALGRLLRVNKILNAYLDPLSTVKPSDIAPLSKSAAPVHQPEVIWQASRRLFCPGMPSPLEGLSELAMWRLACNTRCQYCNRKDLSNTSSADQWCSGPGEIGVRAIWPFGIRACGTCLLERSVKEIDLLLSSSMPSPLLAALPFAFLTNELQLVPASLLQQGPPPNIQITKYFFKPGVEEIKNMFFKVKSMGFGTAEEWLKGLDGKGKSKRADAQRWERFEATGGLHRLLSSSEEIDLHEARLTMVKHQAQISASKRTASAKPAVPQPSRNEGVPAEVFFPQSMPQIATPYVTTTSQFNTPALNSFGAYPSRTLQSGRQERTKEEVQELKAARRVEIERRCMELDPPLKPSVLAHMASFQAAVQIIKPFDENAWELLKPRLLAQREEAEQREAERLVQTRAIQDKFDVCRQQDSLIKEPKDFVDREWEDVQTPLRAEITGYADEIIRDGWNNGASVTKDNSPNFAADVLIYVRKRFYAEIAKADTTDHAVADDTKIDPSNGPFTRKLILENMKWVFDTKVKPITEPYRKELFLCNGCENNFKFYGFEGVIQHYAAKHTSALSMGSIVVHWRAEWPEIPPFNPEPIGKGGKYSSAPSTTYPPVTAPMASNQDYGYSSYQPLTGPAASGMVVQLPPPQPNLAPYYGPTHSANQFLMSQHGQLPPSTSYRGQMHEYPGPHYQGSSVVAFQPYQGHGYMPLAYESQYSSGEVNSIMTVAESTGQSYAGPPRPAQNYGHSGAHTAASGYNSAVQNAGVVRTEEYRAQLLDIARTAREFWNRTTGIKELPGSVRVYVIFYHILRNHRAKYAEDPPLTMLIDGFSNNKDMRPVRNVNGLACRACILGKASKETQSHHGPNKGATDKKLFSLPQLLNHFQTTHVAPFHGYPQYDWTTDMIELPEKKKLKALSRASSLDDHKRQFIAAALPDIFAPSPPTEAEHSAPPRQSSVVSNTRTANELAPSRDHHEKYYAPNVDIKTEVSEDKHHDHHGPTLSQQSPVTLPYTAHHYAAGNPRIYGDYQSASQGTQNGLLLPKPSRYRANERRFADTKTEPDDVGNSPRYHAADHSSESNKRRRRPDPRSHHLDHIANNVTYIQDQYSADAVRASSGIFAREDDGYYPREVYAEPYNHASNRRSVDDNRADNFTRSPRSRHPLRAYHRDAGSEDGELYIQPLSTLDNTALPNDGDSAAERFLNEFVPGEIAEDFVKKAQGVARHDEMTRTRWDYGRAEDLRQEYIVDRPPRSRQSMREEHALSQYPVEFDRAVSGPRSYVPENQAFQDHIGDSPHEYDTHHLIAAADHSRVRVKPRGSMDHLYDAGNVVYLDDMPSHTQPAPPRIPAYEEYRVGLDRQRSRSPAYIKASIVQGRHHESSRGSQHDIQEPVYRTRSPRAPVGEMAYEHGALHEDKRPPIREYYRVYAEDPRLQHIPYEDQIGYVQVNERAGDYVIRRPVPRDRESSYTTAYENERPPRPAIYETRAPVSRSDPAYYEEYDPRNPAPPPPTTIRQLRF